MTMIVLHLLSRLLLLLGLKSRWHRHFSPRPPNTVFFRGEGCRWIRGLRGRNPCAIGIQPVHTRVDPAFPPAPPEPGVFWGGGVSVDSGPRGPNPLSHRHPPGPPPSGPGWPPATGEPTRSDFARAPCSGLHHSRCAEIGAVDHAAE